MTIGNTQGEPLSRLLSSSNLAQADYDPFMGTMTVGFRNGTVYEYYGVEQDIYEQLCEAESAGRFFLKNIKGKYEFSKRGKLNENPTKA